MKSERLHNIHDGKRRGAKMRVSGKTMIIVAVMAIAEFDY